MDGETRKGRVRKTQKEIWMIIFEKTYDGESLYDLSRDIAEAFEEDSNPLVKEVPLDEHGFHKGNFKVTVEWTP